MASIGRAVRARRSVVVEVVVGSSEGDGSVHLEQGLTVRVRLFDRPNVHRTEARFLRDKRLNEGVLRHEVLSRPFRLVRGLQDALLLTRQAKSERCLVVGRALTAVVLQTPPHVVGSADVQVPTVF